MRAGLTLVEIIVVVSLIAIMFSILLPSLYSARERAEDVICQHNQKQMGVALLLYENENGSFPYSCRHDFYALTNEPPGKLLGYLQISGMGWWWQNYMETYLENFVNMEKLIVCPGRNVGSGLKRDLLRSNYGVNMSVCKKYTVNPYVEQEFKGSPLSLKSITSPSKTVLLLDSGYNMVNYLHADEVVFAGVEKGGYIPGASINTEKYSRYPERFLAGQEYDMISGRHSNRTINAAFADGHVQRKKGDDFTVQTEGGNNKNISPLWVP